MATGAAMEDPDGDWSADALPVICWEADAGGRVRRLNARWDEAVGGDPGTDADARWRGACREADEVAVALAVGAPFRLTVHLAGADGRERPHLLDARPAAGGWTATCVEVTERVEAERAHELLLKLGDLTRNESDPDRILQLSSEAIGRALGADRVVYGTVDWNAGAMMMSRDWRADGTSWAPHRVPMPAYSREHVDAHQAGRPILSADVARDPKVAPAMRERFAAAGVGAFISAPMMKSDGALAIMTAQQFAPRDWTEAELRLLVEVAERVWATLERARAHAELRSAERRREFLLSLSDRMRGEDDPAAMLGVAAEELGAFLGVRDVIFSEVEPDGLHLVSVRSWSDGSVPPREARLPIAELGDTLAAAYAKGRTRVVPDIDVEPDLPAPLRDVVRGLGIRAYVTVPILVRDRFSGSLSVQCATQRDWEEADIELIEAVAERSWEALERARTLARLRDSEQLFRSVIEAHPLPVVIAQGDRLLLGNRAFYEMLDLPHGDITRADPTRWEGIRERWAGLIELVRTHDRFDNHERQMMRNGQPFPVSLSWRRIAWRGKPAVIASIIDLTETRRAEAELARSREALHQAEKLSALGSLLAGVSHELNNPLSIVTLQAALLEEMAGGGPLAARAEKIRRAAERCSKIVQTFLAMARQKTPERRVIQAADVARAALDLTEYPLRTAGIAVRFGAEPGLPPIHADADQLHQVLVNLLVNAQQALQDQPAPRELEVRVEAGETPDLVRIEVEDNGPGVPEEIRRRVFEPFFTTKPQGVGTGVGLSFSQGLVEAHGGRLELVDRPRGACFRITLAAAKLAATPAEATAAAEPVREPRGRALVVDDEPELAEALRVFVGRLGFEVDEAGDGGEAIELLRARDYDAILSDLRMPGVDGPAMHDWITREKPHLVARLGFVTGDTMGRSAELFLGRTGAPVIEKPFTDRDVRGLLVRLGAIE